MARRIAVYRHYLLAGENLAFPNLQDEAAMAASIVP